MKFLTGDPATNADIRVRRKPEFPSSVASFHVAKAWIQECISTHVCSTRLPTVEGAQLDSGPARLIDLMASDGESTDARLVDIKHDVPEFATLSYCWGNGMPPDSMTTLANVGDRRERILFDVLPRTVQDAFTVTRGLGIRYLWIDAVCTIQDCRDDWATESAKMASIYGRSQVTVAAELRPDCRQGFFSHKPEEDNPCINHIISIPSILKNGKSSILYI